MSATTLPVPTSCAYTVLWRERISGKLPQMLAIFAVAGAPGAVEFLAQLVIEPAVRGARIFQADLAILAFQQRDRDHSILNILRGQFA